MDFRANLVKAWNIQGLLTLRTWSTFQVTIRLYPLSTGVVYKVISSLSIHGVNFFADDRRPLNVIGALGHFLNSFGRFAGERWVPQENQPEGRSTIPLTGNSLT